VIVLGGYFAAVARWIMAPARTALAARLLVSPTPGTGELAVSDPRVLPARGVGGTLVA
jgi:hypothetical protein